MATYTAGCSSVGGYDYAGYFTLYVELSEWGVNTGANTSNVNYNVYCQSSGSGSLNANHWKYFALNGQEITNETVKVNVSSPNAYISIASGTMYNIPHEADGSRWISFSAAISASNYGLDAEVSGNFTLTTIGRYTTITKFEVKNISGKDGLTKVKYEWSASDACDWAWYSKNNGASWSDLPNSGIISGLSPNTSYNFKLRVRRTSSQLVTESGTKTTSTYDTGRIGSVPNINLGDNINVNITNPSGANITYYVETTNPTTNVLERAAAVGSNTIQFTDEELDTIFKKIGLGNSTNLQVGVATEGSYWDWKTITCTLTGNQKTVHLKLNNEWKRAKRWIKINGEWKRAVRWMKVNDTWHRCI